MLRTSATAEFSAFAEAFLGTETSGSVPNAVCLNVAIGRNRVGIHGRGALSINRDNKVLHEAAGVHETIAGA
jgi:hypothetical protein